jgi:lipopolysaccharide transport system ATP-binding protein
MSSEVVIQASGLGKCYPIYAEPRDRLKQFILPRLQSALGQPCRQYYQEFWALKDVSFEVKKGETIGIIGRNGSGKSTLLQIICNTLHPTTGSITTKGRIAALLELGSGFNPEFTGRENIYINAAILGMQKIEVDRRFSDIASFADIGDFIEQPVKTYSSGMVVRLAFAVIAHVDADILVVDEAFAVGDAFFVQKCMRFIRRFQENGGTMLFVSHDTGAIVNLCDKAILLKKGQLMETGSPKEVSAHYHATLYESFQAIDAVAIDTDDQTTLNKVADDYRDMREEFFRSSNLRNDVEIFQFGNNLSGFGTGEAKIHSVHLLDKNNTPLSWIVGGEDVILDVRCQVYSDLSRPIIGFEIKDRLGQVIFGDNTFLVYQHNPQRAIPGNELIARFGFRLPVLPTGDYTIGVAIANGTQEDHVQHHWLHEALAFKVHASSTCLGLIGIPMESMQLFIKE